MVVTMILLVFFLVMQLSSTWWTDEGTDSNLFLICAFWDFSLTDSSFELILTRGYVIVVILFAHYEKVVTLYSDLGRLPQGEDMITKKRLIKYKVKDFDYRVQAYKKQARYLIVQNPSWRRTYQSFVLVESFAFHETHDSRLWQIAELLYQNIYGAILIFFYRNQHDGTVGRFNTMGFGYQDALEEVTPQSVTTQATGTGGSLHEPGRPESVTDSGVDNQEPQEVVSQGSGHMAFEATNASQGQTVIEPDCTDGSGEAESIGPLPEAENPGPAGADEVNGEHQALVEAESDLRDQIRQELFNHQTPVGAGVAEAGGLPDLDNVTLRSLHRAPARNQNQQIQDRRSPETSTGVSSGNALSRSVTGLGEPWAPKRNDTEACVGISTSGEEELSNAMQANPKLLLARFIREDPFEIREVRRAILTYTLSSWYFRLLQLVPPTYSLALGSSCSRQCWF
ncbi:hypothetical protein A1O3_03157 [Capronia epimyces CBS 606.96]|uniref:Uncharacterized protein n=1 Tax=Capronia epimyces CBS 606.96 TaxID=1182542 RepID=W9YC39_9EURO|nr:uncharacterized protein A1O3_03157 [Capronia epimyces CBS 606.96]EXJ90088.1 hypothetical protein A1O3_03157 [Capronia epimyces CBS 606.96]